MIIKTQEFLRDLDGKDTELTIGKALGSVILSFKSDPLRSYLMATAINKEPEYNLAKADLEWVRSGIKENGFSVYASALVVGQLLDLLNQDKE